MTTITSAIQLGQTVRYTDTKGHDKIALVTATAHTVTEGTDLPTLNEGQFHVTVFSPSGRIYNKFAVADALTVADNDNYKNDDGVLVGVIRSL